MGIPCSVLLLPGNIITVQTDVKRGLQGRVKTITKQLTFATLSGACRVRSLLLVALQSRSWSSRGLVVGPRANNFNSIFIHLSILSRVVI